MSTALFISVSDLKKSTAISGGIDPTKLLPSIKVAQELEILTVLGQDLYEKVSSDIVGGTLSGEYITLLQTYIHPVLIHFSVSYYLPYATYQVTNAGVSKWNGGENYDAIETAELNVLTNKEKSLAESYKKRLIKYLQNNTDLFPEYLSNNDATDIRPSNNTNRSGLFLN